MCGIIGYVGTNNAVNILVEGLKKLEYRGYDSAGIAILKDDFLEIHKTKGMIKNLEDKVQDLPTCNIGIGHTRWATHGKPSDVNSHPHGDCTGKIAVVHNGIIENYLTLKKWLKEQGHTFLSETDTEVLPHLVEHFYAESESLMEAVRKTAKKITGSYAMVVLSKDNSDQLVAARKDSPLVVGLGGSENFFASDISAILNHTRRIYVLDDEEIAQISADEVKIYNFQGMEVNKEELKVDWDAQAAEKGGYEDFMLKEIHEQPQAIRETLRARIDTTEGRVVLSELEENEQYLKEVDKVVIVACGTASYAGQVGKYVIEKLVRLPVEVDLASEFRYREPILNENTLAIVISQSGETADTLAALRLAKNSGCKIVSITNVVGSSVARESDHVLYTRAGPEIAVASTKAYITQLVTLYLFALYLSEVRQTLAIEERKALVRGLLEIPSLVEKLLRKEEDIKEMAEEISRWHSVFFIGRSIDFAVCLEGALKLKEISYIHAEAYAAGELKHGTLALITEGVPVIALVTQEEIYDKTVSNIMEVKARDANVLALVYEEREDIRQEVDSVFTLPSSHPFLSPMLSVVPLQLLAYYTACKRGCNVDKPRNLAKSVTVE